MTTIRIQLDDATYEKVRRAAEAAGQTVEDLAAQALTRRAAEAGPGDPLAGWLADEPGLADAIDAAAQRSRRERYGDAPPRDGPRATDDR